MSKQNFHTLLSRYRNGQCNEREKRLVEQWFSMLDEEAPQRSREENELLEEKLWKIVQAKKKGRTKTRSLLVTSGWKWAAAVFLAAILSVWGITRFRPATLPEAIGNFTAQESEAPRLNRITAKEAGETFVLPDGTEIKLSPHSSLEYPASFEGNKREVLLTGKAFFKVTANPGKPFFVYSGEIVTRVLGTSFWVDGGSPGSAIEVSVVTGKVSVSKRTDAVESRAGPVKGGVILTPNQKVKFSNESDLFETGLVEQPVPVIPGEHPIPPTASFLFEDAPIAEVIARLEEAYGIEIILENDALKGCLFRGDITEQPLFTKLDLLCASVGAGYEIRGTRILVSGKGCSY